MTTATRLWLVFGLVYVLLVVSTVAIIVRVRSVEKHLRSDPESATLEGRSSHHNSAIDDLRAVATFSVVLLIVGAVAATIAGFAARRAIVANDSELAEQRERHRILEEVKEARQRRDVMLAAGEIGTWDLPW